ncbi:hypothetical protein LO771_25930 [Streptacidiphilus sp. ASG 303]|uniref:HAAS signaling domain-containing protein n=1 Tax=Streptacidiphilus sp. ASG 303 TaxID=2896847 RepID=UPI001E35813E|nr:hypothetical protein [Streptacidiphilus sp. ASG 303]MCD0485735.1 hypothetical protein [Streptacidiphilus sp. ASG 303]
MGVESDKLVYDYLGRVSDLARSSLPAAERARLVAELRADIDGRRAAARDTPAAVRRVLERIGPPDEVVRRAAAGRGGGGAGARDGGAAAGARPVPAPRAAPAGRTAPDGPPAEPGGGPAGPRGAESRGAASRGAGLWGAGLWGAGKAGPGRSGSAKGGSADAAGPLPAGPPQDGRGPGVPAARDPEWWRVPGEAAAAVPQAEPGPVPPAHMPTAEDFPGWDGFEIRFESEQPPAVAAPAGPPAGEHPAGGPQEPAAAAPPQRRRRVRLRRGGRPARVRAGRPLLLESLAALLLAAGAVAGLPLPMLLGWLAAYASRRTGRAARRFAVLGIPALAVLCAGVWLWGRAAGRWGGPPPGDEQFRQAARALVPVVLRGAAAGSAVFTGWLALRGGSRSPE